MIEHNDQFVAKAVLTIYESNVERRTSSHNYTDSKTYVEVHPVDAKGNVLAGKPLTKDFANSLGKSLFKETRTLISGRITPNMLFIGWQNDTPIIVWYTPPAKRFCYYTKNLNIPNGEIEVPGLVWRFETYTSSLKLAAVKEPPTDETVLHYAPFHNCYSQTLGVCLGTAGHRILKDDHLTYQKIMEQTEHVFWNTEFSTTHNTQAIKGNLNSLHKKLVEGMSFPIDKLVPTKLKLADLCK